MRPIIYVKEVETTERLEEAEKLFQEAVESLFEYLQSYIPRESAGFSKHAMMGPVGKLIPLLNSQRLEDTNALIGYTLNIHRNTSDHPPNIEALEKAVKSLKQLKSVVTTRRWLRLTQELDYAIYKKKYQQVAERIAEKKAAKEQTNE